MDRALFTSTIDPAQVGLPETAGEAWEKGDKHNFETPHCVETAMVVLDHMFAKRGACFGVVTVYTLPETNGLLVAVVAGGVPATRMDGPDADWKIAYESCLRPYFYESGASAPTGAQCKALEFLLSKYSRDPFTWDCFVVSDDIESFTTVHPFFAEDGRMYDSSHRLVFYGFVDTSMYETLAYAGVSASPRPRITISEGHITLVADISLSVTMKSSPAAASSPPTKKRPRGSPKVHPDKAMDGVSEAKVTVQVRALTGRLFVQEYSSYILLMLASRALWADITRYVGDSPSDNQDTFRSIEFLTGRDLSDFAIGRLYSAFESRFSPVNRLCTETHHYANELFVAFCPTGRSKLPRQLFLMRKNIIYPQSWLVTSTQPGVGKPLTLIDLGSLYVRNYYAVCLNYVFASTMCLRIHETGSLSAACLHRAIPPFTNSQLSSCADSLSRKALMASKAYIVALFFSHLSADNSAAVLASKANYRVLVTTTIGNPFTYYSSAFHVSPDITTYFEILRDAYERGPVALSEYIRPSVPGNTDVSLGLYRPLCCSWYGGTFVNIQLRKGLSLNLILPLETKRLLQPERQFPAHKSGNVHAPLAECGFFWERSLTIARDFDTRDRGATLDMANPHLVSFPLENFSFQSYKRSDRLVNAVSVHAVLPEVLSLLCLDKALNTLCRSNTCEGSTGTRIFDFPANTYQPSCLLTVASADAPTHWRLLDLSAGRAVADALTRYASRIEGSRASLSSASATGMITWKSTERGPFSFNGYIRTFLNAAVHNLSLGHAFRQARFDYAPNYYECVIPSALKDLHKIELDELRRTILRFLLESYSIGLQRSPDPITATPFDAHRFQYLFAMTSIPYDFSTHSLPIYSRKKQEESNRSQNVRHQ